MKHRITFVFLTLSLVLNSCPVFTSHASSGKTGARQQGKPFCVPAIAAGSTHSLALKSDGTVVAWGNNGNGQTTVPAGLSGVVAIAAGDSHSLALKSNGSVVAWGNNDNGRTTVPAGLSGVVAIAGGPNYSLATTLIADVAPTIVVTNITSEAGTAGLYTLRFPVATVSDADDGILSLSVTITKLSGAGIDVGRLVLDGTGKVTADMSVKCTGATISTFALKVTDSSGKSATSVLTVTPVKSTRWGSAHCIPG